MSVTLFETTITELEQGKTNLCCRDVTRLLEGLGFTVRDGKKGGHKVFTHQGLASFTSSSFNCGHGKNPEIKPGYIARIIKTLNQYQTEIVEYLIKDQS